MKSSKGTNTKKRTRPVSDEDDNGDEGNPNKRIAGVDNAGVDNAGVDNASIVTNMITDIVSNNTNDNTTDSSVLYDDSGSSDLYDELSNIITTSQTSPTALGKVTRFIGKLNSKMRQSDAKLSKEQVLDLSSKVNKIISDTYLVQEITNQLSEEPSGEILKQVFHGLIEYYVAMGYYVRERAPDVLTKIGTLLAGSAIIGASVHQTFNIASASSSPGNTLMALASYLPSVSAFGSGLYLLDRGGVNISEKAVSCVEGVQEGCVELVNFASKKLHNLLESDDYSVASSPSSASSASSASSVLSNASSEIKKLLVLAENPDNLKEGAIQEDSEISGLTMTDLSQDLSQDPSQGSDGFFSVPNSPKPGSQGTMHTGDIGSMPSDDSTQIYDPEINGGKRKGQSRRHTKFRKTKRRMKKHHRLTKKGKKHYKTLKRYRRKMRR